MSSTEVWDVIICRRVNPNIYIAIVLVTHSFSQLSFRYDSIIHILFTTIYALLLCINIIKFCTYLPNGLRLGLHMIAGTKRGAYTDGEGSETTEILGTSPSVRLKLHLHFDYKSYKNLSLESI